MQKNHVHSNQNNNFLIIDFYAQAFLWNQIIRIISAIGKIGSGKIEKNQIIDALKNPDKKVDFGLASTEPLILMDIVYDFCFWTMRTFNSLVNVSSGKR